MMSLSGSAVRAPEGKGLAQGHPVAGTRPASVLQFIFTGPAFTLCWSGGCSPAGPSPSCPPQRTWLCDPSPDPAVQQESDPGWWPLMSHLHTPQSHSEWGSWGSPGVPEPLVSTGQLPIFLWPMLCPALPRPGPSSVPPVPFPLRATKPNTHSSGEERSSVAHGFRGSVCGHWLQAGASWWRGVVLEQSFWVQGGSGAEQGNNSREEGPWGSQGHTPCTPSHALQRAVLICYVALNGIRLPYQD